MSNKHNLYAMMNSLDSTSVSQPAAQDLWHNLCWSTDLKYNYIIYTLSQLERLETNLFVLKFTAFVIFFILRHVMM